MIRFRILRAVARGIWAVGDAVICIGDRIFRAADKARKS